MFAWEICTGLRDPHHQWLFLFRDLNSEVHLQQNKTQTHAPTFPLQDLQKSFSWDELRNKTSPLPALNRYKWQEKATMLQPLRFIQLKAWGFLLLLFGSFFFFPCPMAHFWLKNHFHPLCLWRNSLPSQYTCSMICKRHPSGSGKDYLWDWGGPTNALLLSQCPFHKEQSTPTTQSAFPKRCVQPGDPKDKCPPPYFPLKWDCFRQELI